MAAQYASRLPQRACFISWRTRIPNAERHDCGRIAGSRRQGVGGVDPLFLGRCGDIIQRLPAARLRFRVLGDRLRLREGRFLHLWVFRFGSQSDHHAALYPREVS